MSDVFSPMDRSRVMRAVRSRDTGPEKTVRTLVRAVRKGYRLHAKDLPGRPDIVFRRSRQAIFVHGCFWHGHDCARGARAPKANHAYWTTKIARNRARDAAAAETLAALGWRTQTVWECELRNPDAVEARLRDFLRIA